MSNLFDDAIEVVDRSTLEVCATCPMQMRLLRESPRVAGMAAAIGQEVHEVISDAVTAHIETGGMLPKSDLVEVITRRMHVSRPDVQPDVVDALRASVWAIATLLNKTDPDAILKYDGGKGERSGQISWDYTGFRCTQELDLLLATESKEKLRIADWKSGWKMHTTEGVAASFQFTQAAALTFRNYPDVQQVDVQVWNLRQGHPLPAVQFYRSKLEQYEGRILAALDAYQRYDRELIERVPCWASTEKCRICDVAAKCPLMARDLTDPQDLLCGLIAANARAEALTEQLKAAVAKNGGRPIETPDGDSFGEYGAEKPRKTWKVRRAGE